jgi:hypothetical protein
MSDDDDDDLVEQVAREYVQRHGRDSLAILRERAELADEMGDVVSAEAWRDIADAAERML